MTTRLLQIRRALPLLFFTTLLVSMALPASADTYLINATAHPQRLVYGVDNNVTITAIVQNSNGSAVPDGTPVYFNTTLGTIPALGYTSKGQVTVLLGNTTGIGEATITITIGSNRQTLTVEYLGKGGEMAAKTPRISYRLTAKQVYYGVDQKAFDLRENAVFTAPSFTIKADAIQYDLNKAQLNAQNNITITVGKKTLTAEKLIVNLKTNKGLMAVVMPDIAFDSFSLPELDAKEDSAAKATDYHPLSPDPTKTWIVCKDAIVYPNDQIQFRWPKFYLNNFDHLLLELPNHVIDLKSSDAGTFFNSRISFATDAGLSVDFPIYYAANANHIGSLHICQTSRGFFEFQWYAGIATRSPGRIPARQSR